MESVSLDTVVRLEIMLSGGKLHIKLWLKDLWYIILGCQETISKWNLRSGSIFKEGMCIN